MLSPEAIQITIAFRQQIGDLCRKYEEAMKDAYQDPHFARDMMGKQLVDYAEVYAWDKVHGRRVQQHTNGP